ncbi:MAG: hypothetical protein ABJA67_11800 [Chthonomonadales bacterium]
MKWKIVRDKPANGYNHCIVDESGRLIVETIRWALAKDIVDAHNRGFEDDKTTQQFHYNLWSETGIGVPYCAVYETGNNNEDIVLKAFGKEITCHPAQIAFFIDALTELAYNRAHRRTQQLTKE